MNGDGEAPIAGAVTISRETAQQHLDGLDRGVDSIPELVAERPEWIERAHRTLGHLKMRELSDTWTEDGVMLNASNALDMVLLQESFWNAWEGLVGRLHRAK